MSHSFTPNGSLVTSQNVTAPKHVTLSIQRLCGLVTSQNVTAPKLIKPTRGLVTGLVTSQNVTAPKRLALAVA